MNYPQEESFKQLAGDNYSSLVDSVSTACALLASADPSCRSAAISALSIIHGLPNDATQTIHSIAETENNVFIRTKARMLLAKHYFSIGDLKWKAYLASIVLDDSVEDTIRISTYLQMKLCDGADGGEILANVERFDSLQLDSIDWRYVKATQH